MATPKEILKRPYARMVFPEPDGSFRAQVMEFPGCIASGDTAAEALAMVESVAESWIEAAMANGQAIPEPVEAADHSGKLVLRLPKSLHTRAAYSARIEGVSLNQFIANAVAISVGSAEVRQQGFSGVTINLAGTFVNSAADIKYAGPGLQSWHMASYATSLVPVLGTVPVKDRKRETVHG